MADKLQTKETGFFRKAIAVGKRAFAVVGDSELNIYELAKKTGNLMLHGGLITGVVTMKIEDKVKSEAKDYLAGNAGPAPFPENTLLRKIQDVEQSVAKVIEHVAEKRIASAITTIPKETLEQRKEDDLQWRATKKEAALHPQSRLAAFVTGPLGHLRDSVMLHPPSGAVTNAIEVSGHEGLQQTPGHSIPQSAGKTVK